MQIYIKDVTRHNVIISLFQPKFRGVPFGIDPWCCGPYIPKTLCYQPWSYFRCIRPMTYLIAILQRHGLDWIVQCFTSPPTQYRLYGRRFLQVKRPNQQYQSTEGRSTKEQSKQRKQLNTQMDTQ